MHLDKWKFHPRYLKRRVSQSMDAIPQNSQQELKVLKALSVCRVGFWLSRLLDFGTAIAAIRVLKAEFSFLVVLHCKLEGLWRLQHHTSSQTPKWWIFGNKIKGFKGSRLRFFTRFCPTCSFWYKNPTRAISESSL